MLSGIFFTLFLISAHDFCASRVCVKCAQAQISRVKLRTSSRKSLCSEWLEVLFTLIPIPQASLCRRNREPNFRFSSAIKGYFVTPAAQYSRVKLRTSSRKSLCSEWLEVLFTLISIPQASLCRRNRELNFRFSSAIKSYFVTPAAQIAVWNLELLRERAFALSD